MHRPSRAALSLGIAGMAAALLLPLGAAGQKPPAPPASQVSQPGAGDAEPEVFGETIEVRAVNTEVVVEDGAGRRVSGLKPADFVLTVDGKPVPVDYFTEVAEGRSVQGKAAAAPPAPPAAGGVAPGREVGTSYLLFVDDSLGVVPRNRNRMLRGFAEQLARLRPEDRMAVVAFGGRRPVRGLRATLDDGQEVVGQRPPVLVGDPIAGRERRGPHLVSLQGVVHL